MRPKNVITAVLLLFVAASVAVVAVRTLRPNREAAEVGTPAAASAPIGEDPAADLSDVVIAYYFHGNFRCPTCRSIEAYAHEAVQTGFGEELSEGRLHWRVLNYEEPQNQHFVAEFQIVAPSVVLVKMEGGIQTRWESLDSVWDLVGDKGAFVRYVQQETRALLEDSGA